MPTNQEIEAGAAAMYGKGWDSEDPGKRPGPKMKEIWKSYAKACLEGAQAVRDSRLDQSRHMIYRDIQGCPAKAFEAADNDKKQEALLSMFQALDMLLITAQWDAVEYELKNAVETYPLYLGLGAVRFCCRYSHKIPSWVKLLNALKVKITADGKDPKQLLTGLI